MSGFFKGGMLETERKMEAWWNTALCARELDVVSPHRLQVPRAGLGRGGQFKRKLTFFSANVNFHFSPIILSDALVTQNFPFEFMAFIWKMSSWFRESALA